MNFTTFFSYKGGAGRSTTCLNTVPFLAAREEAFTRSPIILMDMDIESAGMTYLLGQQDVFKGKNDVKIFLRNQESWSSDNTCDLADHPFYQWLVPVGKKLGLDDDRAVMFLGVDDSSAQLNRSDVEGRLDEVMHKLRRFAQNYHCKGVVMDSAAGDQFSARLAVDHADKIVFCMKMTHQFRIGTFNYLNKLGIRLGSSADEKDIILLPTVVPQDAILDGVSQMQTSIDDISRRVDDLSRLSIVDDFVSSSDMFGINEVMRFKWKEGVLFKLKDETTMSADEETAYQRYKKLARVICDD
jgi:MinD-like ATPase involved in chromosome partitioning or flagellar assembly